MMTDEIEVGDELYDNEREKAYKVDQTTSTMLILEGAGAKNRGLVGIRLRSGRYDLVE